MPSVFKSQGKALVDGSNGDVYRPSCWHDLAAYVAYLESTDEHDKAQKIMRRVLKGEKVITNMIDASQKILGK